MRRALLLAFVAAVAAVAAVLAVEARAQTDGGVTLTPTKGIRFPDRAFLLRLPDGFRLEPGAVTVLENGEPVHKLALTPSGSARNARFGTVLAIDASNSMRGDPIVAAMEAARSFAARRNANQSLAVVTFGRATDVRLGFTRDSSAIASALSTTPDLSEGTTLYDGVARSIELLRAAGLRSGSVVLLSDGRDIGSTTPHDDVVATARAAGVRVFTVGLNSRQFTPAPLQLLAEETGATYSAATSTEELAGIYAALGTQLASEFLLEYKSLAAPAQTVRVAVEVAGLDGVATATYKSPRLAETPVAPFRRSAIDRILQSWMTTAIIAVLAAALMGLAAGLVFQPRDSAVLRRLGAFVSLAKPAAARRQTSVLSERLLETTEQTLRRRPWWSRFKQEVEIAGINLPAEQIVVLTVMGTILLVWVVSIFLPALIAALAFSAPLFVNGFIRRKAERNRRHFADQLPDNLQVLSSALRAGHSLVGALAVVVDDAPQPSRQEFRRVVADEQLGVPIEDSLDTVADRMRSRDLEQVGLVAALQRQTGGNSAEVLDRVAETIRERAALRRLVRTLTAQGRMARWILTAIPVALFLLITVLNRHYMRPMFERPAGWAMLVVASVMVIAGSYAIKRIVDIKV